MSMTVSVVESSRPDQLVDAAAELGGKISALDVVLATQRRAVAHLREFWRGQAADAAGWRVADDGTVTAPPVPAVLAVLAPAWTAILRKLLALFAGIDAETAAAVTAVMEGPVPESPPGTLGDPRRAPSATPAARRPRRGRQTVVGFAQRGGAAPAHRRPSAGAGESQRDSGRGAPSGQ